MHTIILKIMNYEFTKTWINICINNMFFSLDTTNIITFYY